MCSMPTRALRRPRRHSPPPTPPSPTPRSTYSWHWVVGGSHERTAPAMPPPENPRDARVVVPYLKAQRRQGPRRLPDLERRLLRRRVAVRATRPVSSRDPHARPQHRGPDSSEPYLRRLRGMMAIARNVAINGRASGSSWSLTGYSRARNGVTPSVLGDPVGGVFGLRDLDVLR